MRISGSWGGCESGTQESAGFLKASRKLRLGLTENPRELFTGKYPEREERDRLAREIGQSMKKKRGLFGRSFRGRNDGGFCPLATKNRKKDAFGSGGLVEIRALGHRVERLGDKPGRGSLPTRQHERKLPGLGEKRPFFGKQTHGAYGYTDCLRPPQAANAGHPGGNTRIAMTGPAA